MGSFSAWSATRLPVASALPYSATLAAAALDAAAV